MNTYELTIVMPGSFTPAKKKALITRLEKLIELFKGKIEKTDDWGEIELSYTIKKQQNGIFTHFILELENKSVKALEDKLRTDDDVIRHLLVRKDK